MAGYTRQSVADIINGAEITAPPINAEFNQLVSAFNATTGHAHDGSTGNAPKIDLTTSITGYLPADHGGVGGKNKMDATTAPAAGNDGTEGYAPGSLWENTTNGRVYICVGNSTDAAVWRELVTVFSNNKFEPVTHNTIDLGTSSTRFKDLYLQGGATIEGASTFAGTLGVSGLSTLDSVTVTNAATLNGAVTIGNSSADLVGFNGRVTTSIVPNADDGVDLGSSSNEWRNLYIDGTATIDTLTVDENASIAGTLSVTSTSTLTGDVTMSGAADVTGNATVGGTFDVTGLSTLATVDVNGGNIDGTAIGSSTASSGVFTNLTASGTVNFAGATVSNLGTVTTAAIGGGTINNAVIGGSTPAAITGTTITGTSFVGPVTGDITGDVTGDVTGNVTGDVTGDLTGNVTASSGTSTFNNVTVNGNLNMDATSAATITNLTAPTNDLDAATKLYVDTAVADLVDSAPDSLNTLNELAAAINDDASAYNTLNTAIGEKLPKAGGTMSGAINMGGQKITNAADPTAAQDLATKNYIDTTYIDYSSAADAANDAEKLAINAEDAQYTLSDGTTTGYSALHYAAKAAASYDSFDDRYLGSKASDPTLDNDNNALITGALYFDSTNGVMKVYNGTEWANASSSIEGIKSNFYYTATSGQTSFSGADDNSNTLVIDKAGLVNVYMNGVRLHEDDYTVSAAADSVTLAAGAATGDLIYLEVFGNFAGQSGADVAITGGSITGLTELGIGVDSPLYPLHIQDAANQLATFESTDANANIGFKDSATTSVAQVGVKTNDLFFATGGSEVARITSGGVFGINTDAPQSNTNVHIVGNDGKSGASANVAANELFVDNNGNAGVTVGTSNTGEGYFAFADSDVALRGGVFYNHTDDAMGFRVSSSEYMRIASNGRVGIGTASPASLLHLENASSPALRFVDTTNNNTLLVYAQNSTSNIGTHSNHPLVFDTNGSERMRITQGGSLLIDRTSSALGGGNGGNLQIGSGSGGSGMTFHSSTTGIGDIQFADGTTGADSYRGLIRYDHSSDSMEFRTNAAARLSISSNGHLAVGHKATIGGGQSTTSPDAVLTVQDSGADIGKITAVFGADENTNTITDNTIKETRVGIPHYDTAEEPMALFFATSSSTDNQIILGGGTSRMNAATAVIFRTASNTTTQTGSERMRVNSAGAVLIASTDTDPYDNSSSTGGGIALRETGAIYNAVYQGTPVVSNRIGNDGGILQVRRDGAQVGIIGTNTGQLYIGYDNGSYDVGILFGDNTVNSRSIMPCRSDGSIVTDAVDVGEASARWRNLYLSGGAYIGGTATANKLDDYEEGTFTPVLRFNQVNYSGTYSDQMGRYTKVGNAVYWMVLVQLGAYSQTGNIDISGLPFTANSDQHTSIAIYKDRVVDFQGLVIANSNRINLYDVSDSTGSNGQLTHSDMGTNPYFQLSGWYRV